MYFPDWLLKLFKALGRAVYACSHSCSTSMLTRKWVWRSKSSLRRAIAGISLDISTFPKPDLQSEVVQNVCKNKPTPNSYASLQLLLRTSIQKIPSDLSSVWPIWWLRQGFSASIGIHQNSTGIRRPLCWKHRTWFSNVPARSWTTRSGACLASATRLMRHII